MVLSLLRDTNSIFELDCSLKFLRFQTLTLRFPIFEIDVVFFLLSLQKKNSETKKQAIMLTVLESTKPSCRRNKPIY
uniref:Uncharacterized protein n=1 Tax=Salix viminalis TaxID=40686 RepID=A0A6N2M0L9_SALVM